jgi:Ohr subfamily peroxiredoxin
MTSPLYTAVATARGDGRNGEVLSADGVIDEKLSIPKELGGPGGSQTNPEQLFAAGYAACFHSALRLVAGQGGTKLEDSEVTASVSLHRTDRGNFQLSVVLEARLPGLDQVKADEFVAGAHERCPYSNATRGNIEVVVRAITS